MVYEMPCPDRRFVFVASTMKDANQADSEVTTWASSHGYREPKTDQVYTVFTKVLEAHEWHLMERPFS